MTARNRDTLRLVLTVAVVGGAAVYLLRRGLPTFPSLGDYMPNFADYVPAADTVREGVGDGVAGLGGYVSAAGVGAVEGIGLAVGIPRTSVSQCQADKAAGRWWDASFSCTAGDFVSSGAAAVFGSTNVSQATQADVRRVDNAIDYSAANPYTSPQGMDYRYF